jgi:hypothetical protein
MTRKKEEHLFVPEKLEWMLDGGLETMPASERQLLLVMAETKIQDGYKPTREERRAVEMLRALAGDEYDAQDIQEKVGMMVRGHKKPDTAPLNLPPAFDRLRRRLCRSEEDQN